MQNININIHGMRTVCFNLIHSVVVKRAPVLEPEYLDLNLGSIVTYHPCDLGQVTSAVCVFICKMSAKEINIYKVFRRINDTISYYQLFLHCYF